MAKSRLVSALLVACAAAILLFGAVSVAAADIEPRNNAWTNTSGGAEGPLASNVTRSGRLSVSGDVDWYFFYVNQPGIVSVTLTGASDEFLIYQYGAGGLDRVGNMGFAGDTIQVALNPGLYYVRVEGWMGSTATYYLKAAGANLSATAPNGASVHRYPYILREKLETSYAGAGGPLEPYLNLAGTKDYEGDKDWYYFYNTHTSKVRIGIYDNSGNASGWYSVAINVYKKTSTGLAKYATIFSNGAVMSDNFKDLTLPAGKYYVEITPVVGSYVFSVQGYCVSRAPFATLGTPVVAKVSGSTYKAYGTIAPKHTAGSKVVKVKAYRYSTSTKKWVYKFTSLATTKDYTSAQSKYLAQFSLPSRGTWKFRVFHEDNQHFPVYSGYRVITY